MNENPIPSHLRHILKGEDVDMSEVIGIIVCTCGSTQFAIHYVGDDSYYLTDQFITDLEQDGHFFKIVYAHCKSCHLQHLLFDRDYHGYDGFVCGEFDQKLPRPVAKQWSCDQCGEVSHQIRLRLVPEKISYLAATDDLDEFAPEDWAEAFGYIEMRIRCSQCQKSPPIWMGCETM